MDGYQRFEANPKAYWEKTIKGTGSDREFLQAADEAIPNPAHYALADLENMGILKYLITQNIDNLHITAGSQKVAKFTGTSRKCAVLNAMPDTEEIPGAYAIVHLNLTSSTSTLRLPVNTILFRASGLQVATLGSDRRLTLKKIAQGRDFGTEIEVLSGIGPDDDIVVNPPDSITDGRRSGSPSRHPPRSRRVASTRDAGDCHPVRPRGRRRWLLACAALPAADDRHAATGLPRGG